MDNMFGERLKEIRCSRGQSVEQVAIAANIAASTLRRWESGIFQPRIPELKAVLKILKVEIEAQVKIVSMINAVRGVREQRALIDNAPEKDTGAGPIWRALRLRRGLSAKEVAERLAVHPSTVSRWEASKRDPPGDLLPALFAVLQASPEEREALILGSRAFLLAEPLEGIKIERYESLLAELNQKTCGGRFALADLTYCALEGGLTQLAQKSAFAYHLLARTWLHHADYLSWKGRLTEMNVYATRAAQALDNRADPISSQAAYLQAHYIWQHPLKGDAGRALRFLRGRYDLSVGSVAEIAMCRDLACLAAYAGAYHEAIDRIQRSRMLANIHDEPGAIQMADAVETRTFLLQSDWTSAIKILSQRSVLSVDPRQRVFEHLLWAETLLGLKDPHNAHDHLQAFYSLIEASDLDYLRWNGDRLAKRL